MLKEKNVGKPDEGKPHVRFDEEGLETPALYSIWMSLLVKQCFIALLQKGVTGCGASAMQGECPLWVTQT